MIETDSTKFIIAIAFTAAMIMLVVGMYGFHLVLSGKRLRKVQRLAAAAIEFTPAFITIVLDEHDRMADLKIQDPAHEEYFRKAFSGKKKQELSFLPEELRIPSGAGKDLLPVQKNEKATSPLKMPDGGVLYIKWEMQNFLNDAGRIEFRIARGYDMTTELLQTQRKLKALSATSSVVEERERKRIAEDLHDRIGEIMITSSRLLRELKKKSPSTELSQGLEELGRTIDTFTQKTRSLIFDLIPPVLYSLGFSAAVTAMAVDFKKQHKITIRVEDALPDFQINQEIAIFLYKAVREFILNAIKHGGADEILVTIARTNHTIKVTVQDNGSGFAPASNQLALSTEAGFGLFNVKNRAEYYQGGIDISDSADLGGGQIMVWVSQPSQEQAGGNEGQDLIG